MIIDFIKVLHLSESDELHFDHHKQALQIKIRTLEQEDEIVLAWGSIVHYVGSSDPQILWDYFCTLCMIPSDGWRN